MGKQEKIFDDLEGTSLKSGRIEDINPFDNHPNLIDSKKIELVHKRFKGGEVAPIIGNIPSFKINETNPTEKQFNEFVKAGNLKQNILALDVATNTGFCTRSGSGVWKLAPKKDESKGMRLIRFKAKLKEVCVIEEIKLIVFEGAVTYGKFPNMVGPEMIGVLKLFCEENGIEYRSYMPKEIKKIATGNGNAGKPLMIAAAKQKYNMASNDDNEADALHLYHHAIEDLNV